MNFYLYRNHWKRSHPLSRAAKIFSCRVPVFFPQRVSYFSEAAITFTARFNVCDMIGPRVLFRIDRVQQKRLHVEGGRRGKSGQELQCATCTPCKVAKGSAKKIINFSVYLFQFLANEVESLENGISRSCNGNNPLGAGSIRYVDARSRLLKRENNTSD